MEADSSSPGEAAGLAVHLRALGPEGLARLLRARDDAVAAPCPATLEEVAERLLRPGSAHRAARDLPLPALQVAEAFAALSGPAPVALAAALLGVPAEDPDFVRALTTLCGLGLLWPQPETDVPGSGGRMATGTLGSLWYQPLELENPVADIAGLVAQVHSEDLARVLGVLGLPAEAGVEEQRAVLVAHHSDGERVRALLATAPQRTRDLLERLARANTTSNTLTSDDEGVGWAAERGLLVERGELTTSDTRGWGYSSRDVRLPAEILIALRGPRPAAAFRPAPPEVALVPAEKPVVPVQDPVLNTAAGAAVRAFLGQAGVVLDACAREPLALEEGGGVAVAELSRLARACGCSVTVVRLVLECGHAAGLLARDGKVRLGATTGYDRWAGLDPADRYTQLTAAWWRLPYTPTLALASNGRDKNGARQRPRPALGPRPACEGCQDLRRQLLSYAAYLSDNGKAVAPHSPAAAFRALLGWHAPRALDCTCDPDPWRRFVRAEPAADHLAPLLREAALLGLLADSAATVLAAVLLTGPDNQQWQSDLADTAGQLLPEVCERADLAGDLTVRVAGLPAPRLAAALDQVADREGGPAGRLWCITSASLTRALDAGLAGDAILAALRTITGKAAPAPLARLVRETARAHQAVRVCDTGSVLAGEADALATIAADPALGHLRLRLLAPTVIASPAPASEVLAALHEHGHGGTGQQDGRVAVRADMSPRRLPAPAPAPDPVRPDDQALAALARTLTSGPDGQPSAIQHSATETLLAADTALLDTAGIRRLAHAIDHGHTVTIHYTAGSAGSKKTAEHTVHALELDPPYLHALTTADDEPLSLHLADVRDAGLQP